MYTSLAECSGWQIQHIVYQNEEREGEDYVHSSVYKTDHEFQALCSFDEWLFVCMWASVSIQIYIFQCSMEVLGIL